MTILYKAATSFSAVLGAGILIFTWQAHQLEGLRKTSATMKPGAKTATRAGESNEVLDIAGRRRSSSSRDFKERVNEKVVASIKPERIAPGFGGTDRLLRIGIAVNLSPAEREAFKNAFEKFDLESAHAGLDTKLSGEARTAALDDIASRRNAWIAEHLGPERNAALKVAEESFRQARAEQQAASAVSRLSGSVNLSLAQKDALYAGFRERELRPDGATPPVAIKPFARMSLEPPKPDLQEEAKQILTPEQWQAYQEIAESKRQAKALQAELMSQVISEALPTIRDMAAERRDSPSAR